MTRALLNTVFFAGLTGAGGATGNGFFLETGADFFGAACAELMFNLTFTTPQVVSEMLAGYAAFSFFCGLIFGAEWLRRGEMFTVLECGPA